MVQCDIDRAFSPGGDPSTWDRDRWDQSPDQGTVHCVDRRWHTVNGTPLIKINGIYLVDGTGTGPVLADEAPADRDTNPNVAAGDADRDEEVP